MLGEDSIREPNRHSWPTFVDPSRCTTAVEWSPVSAVAATLAVANGEFCNNRCQVVRINRFRQMNLKARPQR